MKQIVYTVTSNGIDGREPTTVVQAFLDEEERNRMLNASKNKNWRSKGEMIVDMELARKQALAQLDGLERLVLGLEQRT